MNLHLITLQYQLGKSLNQVHGMKNLKYQVHGMNQHQLEVTHGTIHLHLVVVVTLGVLAAVVQVHLGETKNGLRKNFKKS